MSDTVSVRLSWFEVMHCAQATIAKRVMALRDERQYEEGRTDLGFDRGLVGDLGEYAVSRALNVCWQPSVGRVDTERGDVGGRQVKATMRPNGCLIVRTKDPARFDYILAIVRVESGIVVDIIGWIDGVAAKAPHYWRDRAPEIGVHQAAHFVPQDDLRPLSELP